MNPSTDKQMNPSADHWRRPWVIEWTQYLLDSYAYWLKKELIPRQGTLLEQAERLFTCPFVVVSHGLQDDPILNYGNRTALTLWEMDWDQLTQTPSRQTAEPVNREERARMLHQAKTKGFIADYRGVRISRSGKRFLVERATVWNIRKPDGTPLGQAATFSTWTFI
jgi:MEKHLA domain-containing protein